MKKITMSLYFLLVPTAAISQGFIEERGEVKVEVYANGLLSSAIISNISKHEGYDREYEDLKRKFDESQKKVGNLTTLYQDAIDNVSDLSYLTDDLKDRLSKALMVGDIEQNYYYLTGEYGLTEEQSSSLSAVFKAIRNIPNIAVSIKGRADARGDIEYNNELSLKRADYISSLAIKSGVPKGAIRSEGLGIVGEKRGNHEMYFFDRYSTVKIYIDKEK